jgi:small-conductance mechanosensitive channel
MTPIPTKSPAFSCTLGAAGGDGPLGTVGRWLGHPVLSNPLSAWLIAGVFAVALYFGLRMAQRVVVNRLRKYSRLTERVGNLPEKLLADVRWWCILVLAVFAASRVLALPSAAASAIRLAFIVAVSAQLLITSRIVVDFVIASALNRAKGADGQPDPSIASASGIIRFMTMLVLVSLLVLFALANMGVEITPLITGLGIGGIAVALAAQSLLGDVFGSLTILFDKPFLVGDFIVVGDKMGTVENIGVKTTRLKALSGEQLVFSNTDLLGSRIQNFKRMAERRVAFAIGIVYETPVEKVQRVPTILRECVMARESVRMDRAHFKSFGAYSLDFEVVYFVLSPQFNPFMDIQEAINLDIMRRFEAEGIQFAYPTAIEIQRRDPMDAAERAERRPA